MPDGTLAGGGMPGPVLDVHAAEAGRAAGAADASCGTSIAITRNSAARPATTAADALGRAGFRFLWIDPNIGDGLRNEIRTVLLA
jgi:hypothetical protein